MPRPLRLTFIAIVAGLLLAACGNKGALIMPAPKPQSVPPPADQTEQPKEAGSKSGTSP